MPTAPPRHCPSGHLVRGSRCRVCKAAQDKARGTTTQRGLGRVYQAKRSLILARDGGVCWLCGQPGADTVDHVVPRSAFRRSDGTVDAEMVNHDGNLRAAHARCNYGR